LLKEDNTVLTSIAKFNDPFIAKIGDPVFINENIGNNDVSINIGVDSSGNWWQLNYLSPHMNKFNGTNKIMTKVAKMITQASKSTRHWNTIDKISSNQWAESSNYTLIKNGQILRENVDIMPRTLFKEMNIGGPKEVAFLTIDGRVLITKDNLTLSPLIGLTGIKQISFGTKYTGLSLRNNAVVDQIREFLFLTNDGKVLSWDYDLAGSVPVQIPNLTNVENIFGSYARFATKKD